jgi:hypothetical protein
VVTVLDLRKAADRKFRTGRQFLKREPSPSSLFMDPLAELQALVVNRV